VIVVSVRPDEILVDQLTDVTLCLENTGPGVCTNVRFTFRVPKEILLIRGRRQVQVARLRKGEHYDHPLQVQAREQGTFQLVSTNFSYRDSSGRGQRVPETVLSLRAVTPTVLAPAPAPSLELTLETTNLPVDAWSPLSGCIANVGEVAVQGVTLSASGLDLQADREQVGDLPPGLTLPFTLSVRVTKAGTGTRVPIRLEAAFRDRSGRLRHRSWRAHLAVEAIQPGTSEREADTLKGVEMKRYRILVVFANPKGSIQLRLQAEERVIRQCRERSKNRDNLHFDVRSAATIDDVARALLEEDYHIVQFSGHGTGQGLAFENELGEVQLVPQGALAAFLAKYSPPLECVVLNACYSNVQGELLSNCMPWAIAMEGAISDDAATEFTRGFYDAIGAGRDIEFAYREGCDRIKLKGFPDGSIPVIFKQGT
jgi:hypothetical protein